VGLEDVEDLWADLDTALAHPLGATRRSAAADEARPPTALRPA
jgi:hypothetical protein